MIDRFSDQAVIVVRKIVEEIVCVCVRTPTLGPDYGYTLVHDVDQRFAADLLEWEGGGGGSTATSSWLRFV